MTTQPSNSRKSAASSPEEATGCCSILVCTDRWLNWLKHYRTRNDECQVCFRWHDQIAVSGTHFGGQGWCRWLAQGTENSNAISGWTRSMAKETGGHCNRRCLGQSWKEERNGQKAEGCSASSSWYPLPRTPTWACIGRYFKGHSSAETDWQLSAVSLSLLPYQSSESGKPEAQLWELQCYIPCAN